MSDSDIISTEGLYSLNKASQVLKISNSTTSRILEELKIEPLKRERGSSRYLYISEEDLSSIREFLKKVPNTREFFYKKSSMKKYGVPNPFQSPKVKDKIKETCNDRYGVPFYSQSKDFETKFKESSQRKYGVDNPSQSEEIKKKIVETNLAKYGVKVASLLKETQKKAEETCIKRYGVSNPSQCDPIKEKIQDTKNSTIKRIEKERDCTLVETLIKKYGQGWRAYMPLEEIGVNGRVFIPNSFIPKIEEYFKRGEDYSVSRSEREIRDFVSSLYEGPLVFNDRTLCYPFEVDIYIPDKKLAIEFNGNYWHSSLLKPQDYHKNKSLECEKKGIRLIHIYEWEWTYCRDKIESLLKIALGKGYSKIGARECEVKKITNREALPFNESNHLQGHRNALVTYGLFYRGELVQLMSFSHNRKYEWEIIRGCPGSNNQVIGGVSKLFKRFVKDYDPSEVFSYCDFNKFDGKSYEALGMELLGYTVPDKFYINTYGYRVNRNPQKREDLENTSKYTIYGSGSKKYLWKKNH